MKLMSNELFKAVRYALYAGATAAVGLSAGTVFAQDAAPDQNSQKLETITVTGSHIRRVDIETANPVVTIDAATIAKTGKQTVGDILNELPSVIGAGSNPLVNNGGGSGSTLVGLRGLTPARTLTLVDGHRIVNADLNSIPIGMIERIEVLSDGASAVYGSDAIGGVINIITRHDYQGAEFSTDYGISDKDDGVRKGYRFTFGQTSDKGSIVGGIDYNKTEQVLAGNRAFSAHSVSITNSSNGALYGFVGGSSSAPFGHFQIPKAFAGDFPGCASGYVARNAGASGASVSDYHCFLNNGPASDKYNYAAVNLITTPQERSSVFVNGTYHLTDNVDAYLDVYHNKTSSGFQLAPAPVGSLVSGLSVSAQSYYNPFGVDYTKGQYIFSSRLVAAGFRGAKTNNTTDQVNSGLKGTFNIFNQAWTWDAGFGYGHLTTENLLTGLPNGTLVNAGLGPSFLNSAGQVQCGTAANPIDLSTCIPFDAFNPGLTPTALTAAASDGLKDFTSIEKVEHLDFSGGVFDLPAGTMQLALGGSHRSEYTNDAIDSTFLTNVTTGTCILGTQCSGHVQGGYTVKEVYAELFIPILKDLPFIKSLNVTLGDRYSKYSSFGSTSNPKLAVEWRPIDDLLLRGTVAKVFRAPTLGDVFGAPASDAPLLTSDPCDFAGSGANPNAGSPACKGVPATGPFKNQNVAQNLQITALAAGSNFADFPLGPENGKSFDFGFVYSPEWLTGLSTTVDLYRIYLLNNITGVSAQTVIDQCFAGVSGYCPSIFRTQGGPNAGQIDHVIEPTANLGRLDTSGVDFSLAYRLPEFAFGRFNLGMNATYLRDFNQQTAPGLPGNADYHNAGHLTPYGSGPQGACGASVCLYPRWRATTFVNWQLGAFDASWRTRYIGRFSMGSADASQDTTAVVPGVPFTVLKYGATVYNDVSFGYNIEPINTRIDIGVDNVTNKQPPFLYANDTINANTDPFDFDLLGRYYFSRITVKF
jgi:outer membrane receptor protein involved in Fe transport